VIGCFFVTDLHGHVHRYQALFRAISAEKPDAVFLGGDLLPHGAFRMDASVDGDFIGSFLVPELRALRAALSDAYPRIFTILGNDDARAPEPQMEEATGEGLFEYIHGRTRQLNGFTIYGYAFVPPTPFLIKDWERYDVSQHVDPGCVSPEEGYRTFVVQPHEVRFATIAKDLKALVDSDPMDNAVFLFHSPPYQTALDRAALDGKLIDHVPLDVHVGSVAIRRFIEKRQPWLTLHGHVHESAHLTGQWSDRIGRTIMINAAHDGRELALVRFALEKPEEATRELIGG